AEFAVVVPAVVLVLACCLAALHLATQQLRLQDAAALTARSVARGEPPRIDRLVAGATARVESRGNLVCVIAQAPGPAAAGWLGSLTIGASSCALGQGR